MKWLFLVHQVHTPDSRERVKVWRMTKKVGAILYRNSVYVLPYSKERLEDFQWLSQQIRDSKGDASLFVSESQDEKENRALRTLFENAKKDEYAVFMNALEAITSRVERISKGKGSPSIIRGLTKENKRLQEEFSAIQKTDFFKHPLAHLAASALKETTKMIDSMESVPDVPVKSRTFRKKDFQRKTWSTREHIHIDRVCSAWLIRRFIDRKAKFVFAAETNIPKGTIPFDVLGAEFSHQGDNCSFETLLRAFQMDDAALAAIAQIVHDIDLKDQKYGRPEASGVDVIIRSLSDTLRDDRKVLEVGSILCDALYDHFSAGTKMR